MRLSIVSIASVAIVLLTTEARADFVFESHGSRAIHTDTKFHLNEELGHWQDSQTEVSAGGLMSSQISSELAPSLISANVDLSLSCNVENNCGVGIVVGAGTDVAIASSKAPLFTTTVPVSLHLRAMFSVDPALSASDHAFATLGVYRKVGDNDFNLVFNWRAFSNWMPGTAVDNTIALEPGEYWLDWGAQLSAPGGRGTILSTTMHYEMSATLRDVSAVSVPVLSTAKLALLFAALTAMVAAATRVRKAKLPKFSQSSSPFSSSPGTLVSKSCLTRSVRYGDHHRCPSSRSHRQVPSLLRPLVRLRRLVTVDQGALTSLHCATAPELAQETGLYYDECKPMLPSPSAQDDALVKELRRRSEEWVASYP